MLALGTNEFMRNIKNNIIVIIQITIVYAIALFVTSSFIEQYKMMNAIDGFLDDTGVMMASRGENGTEGVYVTEEALREELVKVEQIACAYRIHKSEEQYSLFNGKNFHLVICYYDLDCIDFVPKLSKGDWCDEYKHTEGIINIVVSNHFPLDVEVGGTFDVDGNTYRITGVYDENELTISHLYTYPTEASNGSYLDYYVSIGEVNASAAQKGAIPTYLVYASYEDVIREQIGPSIYSMLTVDYYDDITATEIDANEKVLVDKYGYTMNMDATSTKPIYDYSMRLLGAKLLPMIFIFVVVFAISATCLVTSGAINVLYEKRNYGIYFICGNNWRKTLQLSFINWSCIAGTSLILAICVSLLMKASGKFDNLALSFSAEHVIVIVTITVIMLLLALVLPYRMLKKLQPVNILKDNDK